MLLIIVEDKDKNKETGWIIEDQNIDAFFTFMHKKAFKANITYDCENCRKLKTDAHRTHTISENNYNRDR